MVINVVQEDLGRVVVVMAVIVRRKNKGSVKFQRNSDLIIGHGKHMHYSRWKNIQHQPPKMGQLLSRMEK
jgi:hypothetical protein